MLSLTVEERALCRAECSTVKLIYFIIIVAIGMARLGFAGPGFQGQEEVDPFFIISVNFRLDGKAQGELDVVVDLFIVGAIGSQLVATQLGGSLDGALLQGRANALAAVGRVDGKSVDLGFGQGSAI